MKKFIRIIAAALIACLALSGCSDIKNVKNIKLTSYKIDSIVPSGLKSIDVKLTLGVDNPAMYLKIDGANGRLCRLGQEVGTFSVDPIALEGHCEGKYTLTGNITLSPGVSILTIMKYAATFNLDEYTIDLFAPVKLKSGLGVKLKYVDTPLKELFDK
ncbi:MAG: hypothetical protein MJY56_06390 [Bacteroidales bacterium]|nr:hypothetical protein [Bacteroidales bacterium]